jgi:hypothetical protein
MKTAIEQLRAAETNDDGTPITRYAGAILELDKRLAKLEEPEIDAEVHIHNLEARLSKLESAQQPSPHSCGITGHSIRCECTLPADDAAPNVDDSLKLIIDPFFNTLTMRGEVPDDFNLQDALKAAIEILERAQMKENDK